MKRQSLRKRLHVSHWYVGAGNKNDLFSRTAPVPFEDIRKVYGKKSKKPESMQREQKPLTANEKALITAEVRKLFKKNYLRMALIILCTVVITILFVAAVVYLLENVYF